jgi:hypothetical protein
MSISRYDYTPNQSVINTYVKLPYEDIMQNLAMKEHTYAQSKQQEEDNSDNFLKVQALEKDKALRQQILDGYRKDMSDAYDKVKGDYGQLGEFGTSQAKKIKSDLTYGRLGAIHGNYLLRSAHQKEIEDNKDMIQGQKEGLLKMDYDNYKGVQSDVLPDGKYNRYNGTIGAKYVDIHKVAEDLGKGYEADKIKNGQWRRSADGVLWRKGTHGEERVTYDEIYKGVQQGLRGNKELKDYMHQDALIKSHGTNATPEDILNYHSKNFHDASDRVANKFSFNRVENDDDLKFTPEHILAGEAENAAMLNSNSYSTGAGTNKFLENVHDIDDNGKIKSGEGYAVVDAQGKEYTPEELQKSGLNKSFVNSLYGQSRSDDYTKKLLTSMGLQQKPVTKLQDEVNGKVDEIVKASPQLAGMKPADARKEAIKIYKDVHENSKNVTSDYIEHTTAKQKAMNLGELAGSLGNLEGKQIGLIKPKENGGGSYENLNNWEGIQSAITGDQEVKDIKATTKGKSIGNPLGMPYADVVEISVTGKDNKVHKYELLVGTSKEQSAIMQPVQEAYEHSYSGKPGSKIIPLTQDGSHSIKVDNFYKKGVDGKYRVHSTVSTIEDGKVTDVFPSLEQFGKSYRNAYLPQLKALQGTSHVPKKDIEIE